MSRFNLRRRCGLRLHVLRLRLTAWLLAGWRRLVPWRLRCRIGGWRFRARLRSRQAAWRLRRWFLDRREDELFDGLGWYIGPPFPGDCIADLTAPGSADQAAEYWLKDLDFRAPRKLAVDWLREFGCWEDDELAAMSGHDIDLRVLWIACGDIRDDEQYEGGDSDRWQGLIH